VANLAYKLRPQSLEEFFGQKHLVGEGRLLRRLIENKTLSSLIFWGPPGSGKTTLAKIIARSSGLELVELSAVSAGKEDLKKIIQKGLKTILFIDEIHRWNKAQQDALLPFVENGQVILIGATTENPSFEVISPLLSRCRVFVLEGLGLEDLNKILDRGLKELKIKIKPDAQELLIRLSGGDARIMLNALELCQEKIITIEEIQEVFQTKTAGIYDKKADEHYNTISAFIKSMRGSDPDAALYYLSRMLINGEDPKFIARRMIIFSCEDIGLADRGALIQANACFDAVTKIGVPEAQRILASTVLYLATAKKSRAVENALHKAMQAATDFPNEPIPLHLRNAPTKLMKELGYAKDYGWSEKYVGPLTGQSFLPEKLKNLKFFEDPRKV
jgi:putative ATPase